MVVIIKNYTLTDFSFIPQSSSYCQKCNLKKKNSLLSSSRCFHVKRGVEGKLLPHIIMFTLVVYSWKFKIQMERHKVKGHLNSNVLVKRLPRAALILAFWNLFTQLSLLFCELPSSILPKISLFMLDRIYFLLLRFLPNILGVLHCTTNFGIQSFLIFVVLKYILFWFYEFSCANVIKPSAIAIREKITIITKS